MQVNHIRIQNRAEPKSFMRSFTKNSHKESQCSTGLDKDYCVCVCVCVFVLKFSVFHFFFFFFGFHVFQEVMWLLFINNSHIGWLFHDEQYTRTLFMDPQIPLFSNFFIKNESHDTIHTFKNYFATVFLVFSFQFQQNKFYPNGPVIY